MHKLKIKKLTLKKDCSIFLKHFFDVSTDFLLLLLIHQDAEVSSKIAFLEAGTTFKDYSIHLDSDNTRVLHAKNFEFEFSKQHLEFSLVLLDNYKQLVLNRTKIKKLVYQNESIKIKDERILIYQLLKITIPMEVLGQELNVKFDNSKISILFSLKTA